MGGRIVSSIEYRVSSIECRVSSVEYRVSSIEYRVSHGQMKTLWTLEKKNPISAYHIADEKKRTAKGYKEKHSAAKSAVGSENRRLPSYDTLQRNGKRVWYQKKIGGIISHTHVLALKSRTSHATSSWDKTHILRVKTRMLPQRFLNFSRIFSQNLEPFCHFLDISAKFRQIFIKISQTNRKI